MLRCRELAGPSASNTIPSAEESRKSSPTTTSIFVYDADNLIETVNATGGVVARYTQGQNVDEPLASAAGPGPLATTKQDGIGSVTSLTSSTGTLAQTYTYDSFVKRCKLVGITNKLVKLYRPGVQFGNEPLLQQGTLFQSHDGRFLSEKPLL